MDGVTASAIIGACSALAGVFLSQVLSMLQASAERKHNQKTLRREKLEELAGHLAQTARWMDIWFHQVLLKSTAHHESADGSPLSSDEARRVYVLSLLYFPDLKTESQRVMKALDVLHFLGQEASVNEGKIVKASEDFSDAKKELEKLIAEEAGKLIQS